MTYPFNIGQLVADDYTSGSFNLEWTDNNTIIFHSVAQYVSDKNLLLRKHGRIKSKYKVDCSIRNDKLTDPLTMTLGLSENENLFASKQQIFYFLLTKASTFKLCFENDYRSKDKAKLTRAFHYQTFKTCNIK